MALRITLMQAPAPRTVTEMHLQLPAGATVADALRAARWLDGTGELPAGQFVGIWGRKTPLDQTLQDGDRVELVRDLRVDPKVARRERFARQGARSTGLFARQRPGGKSGY